MSYEECTVSLETLEGFVKDIKVNQVGARKIRAMGYNVPIYRRDSKREISMGVMRFELSDERRVLPNGEWVWMMLKEIPRTML